MAASAIKDNWTSEAYQASASFVPQLATKIVEWLDVQPGDRILDVGCGDGVLTAQLATHLSTLHSGSIHGIDSSPSMINSAESNIPLITTTTHASSKVLPTYAVLDANSLHSTSPPPASLSPPYTKIFSNAALHWILRTPSTRITLFPALSSLLRPSGTLVFEMGGHGNVSEATSVLLLASARRIGIAAARAADPWFFPDELWMRQALEAAGFEVRRMETQYRATRTTDGGKEGGGVEGWVRLMGKTFLDAVEEAKGVGEREGVVREVVEALETVCRRAGDGAAYLGYVRLRVEARKI